MDKHELIKKIMEEVKDEKLRDELLKQIFNRNKDEQKLLSELSNLGINPNGVKEYVGFSLKAQIIVGYIVSSIFLLGGGIGTLILALSGNTMSLFVFLFAAAGLYGFISTRKLHKAIKRQDRGG